MAKAKSENGVTADEVAKDVSEGLSELGREARKRADDAKDEAVKGLNTIAETIRREAREAGAEDSALKSADEVAAGLERAAHYLKENSVDDIREAAEEQMKENPWVVIALALIVGFAIGLILRGGRR